jgi:type IV pilus assembly protein PilZ
VKPDERRAAERFEVTWAVDCETPDTFLYASITNISALGIFVQTTDPLPPGTRLVLKFAPPGLEPFTLHGLVQWVNVAVPQRDTPNPGMGIRFTDLSSSDRERLIDVIKTIAYVRDVQSVPPTN